MYSRRSAPLKHWYYHAVLFLPAVFFLKGNEKLNGEGGLDLHAEEGLI
jgi:hypothetical protein